MTLNNEQGGSLGSIRQQIDDVDRRLVQLILDRAELAKKVGDEKRKTGQPVYRPDREKEVYQNVLRQAKDRPILRDRVLEDIYREIINASHTVEGGPAVAYLGPPASFSHLAARMRFGSALRSAPQDSIPDVFRSVEAGSVDYGMVPVDNTREGSVGYTMDSLLTTSAVVYAEMYLRVEACLLHHEKVPLTEIRRLYMLKIAAEQCRNWLAKNLPLARLEVVEAPSTAAAAKLASERKDGAAIASELAAETYGLQILERHIHDNANNMTRFFVIGNDECPPTGDDKTSIICAVHDRPGSLYEMLEPFHSAGVNLTRIESRATGRTYGDYNFFLDFLGHYKDDNIKKILSILEERTAFVKLLGSYPRANLAS
ncbi:MAG: prephenate dehydratase [Spirochaetia bacterium]|nr:prephenate dehydratase [Spirochaetia bacterium]